MDVEVLKKLLESDDPAARQQCRDLLVARRPEAWEVLVTRFTRMVFAIARRYFRDDQDAKQASQETFAELVKDCAQYDPQRPFRPWIARVAYNTVFDLLRDMQAQKRLPERPLISLSDPAGNRDDETLLEIDRIINAAARDPEQVTMLRELLERVEQCLPRLPAKEKSVFLLVYRYQLSYVEVSAVLRLPEGTVRSSLHQARALLKDCVEY